MVIDRRSSAATKDQKHRVRHAPHSCRRGHTWLPSCLREVILYSTSSGYSGCSASKVLRMIRKSTRLHKWSGCWRGELLLHIFDSSACWERMPGIAKVSNRKSKCDDPGVIRAWWSLESLLPLAASATVTGGTAEINRGHNNLPACKAFPIVSHTPCRCLASCAPCSTCDQTRPDGGYGLFSGLSRIKDDRK